MNTNLQITLSDEQRSHIQNLIDGKQTFKKVGRADVKKLVQNFIDELMETNMTDANVVVKQSANDLSGFHFYADKKEINFKEFIKFSCDDCGCMVSVAENKLKSLPEDETGLGQFWQDAVPEDVEGS